MLKFNENIFLPKNEKVLPQNSKSNMMIIVELKKSNNNNN
jgi:hypothetical protein